MLLNGGENLARREDSNKSKSAFRSPLANERTIIRHFRVAVLQVREGKREDLHPQKNVDDNHEEACSKNKQQKKRVKQQKKNSVFVDELLQRRDCSRMLLSFALI